jgi:deoxycytidine triphosphate deaminase
MLLIYSGPHPEVVVDELDQSTVIKAGEPVEIPNDLAARLLEQSTWSRATVSAPASTDDADKGSN